MLAVYKERLPFTKPAPIDEEETTKQKKQKQGQKKKQKGQGDSKVTDAAQNLNDMNIDQ